MKKKNSLVVLVLFSTMLLVGTAVFVEACKKRPLFEDGIAEVLPEEMSPMAEKFVSGVKKFKEKVVLYRKNLLKSDEYITLDSAAWNIESLFNVSYAFPEEKYEKNVSQDLQFVLPVSKSGMAKMSDVSRLYDEVVDKVRDAYSNDGIADRKKLKSVIVWISDKKDTECTVNVRLVSGRSASPDNDLSQFILGPFKEGDCWYFGEYGGTCEDPTIGSDAAEEIEAYINYNYAWNHGSEMGRRTVLTNILRYDVPPYNYYDDVHDRYYLFYTNINDNASSLYIDASDLNYYYWGAGKVFLDLVPIDENVPQEYVFFGVNIEGVIEGVHEEEYAMFKSFAAYGIPLSILENAVGKAVDILEN